MRHHHKRHAGFLLAMVAISVTAANNASAQSLASTDPTPTTIEQALSQRFMDVASPDADQASAAITALTRYGQPEVIPALIIGLRDGAAPRQAYIDALTQLTGEKNPPRDWQGWTIWLQRRDGWPKNPAIDRLLVERAAVLDSGYRALLPPVSELAIPSHDLIWMGDFLDQAGMIDHPKMNFAHQAPQIVGSDVIIGLADPNLTARAYPLRLLAGGTVINDEWNGIPVSIVYHPVCGTAQIFDRRQINPEAAQAPLLRPTGLVHRSRPLIYERTSRGLWDACTGRALTTDPAHAPLAIMTATTTSWARWSHEFPNSMVMTDTRSAARAEAMINQMSGYPTSPRTAWPVAILDDQYHAKDQMIAIPGEDGKILGLESMARLADRDVVNGRFGEKSLVLITENPNIPTVRAFQRTDRFFEPTTFPDRVTDQDGALWRVTENGLIGPNQQILPRVPVYAGYWFVFQDQLPDASNRTIRVELPPRPVGPLEMRQPVMPPVPNPPVMSMIPSEQTIAAIPAESSATSGATRQPKQPVTFGKLRFPPLPKAAKPANMTPAQEAGLEKMPGKLTEVERRRLAAQAAKDQAAKDLASKDLAPKDTGKKNILKPPSDYRRNPDEKMVQPQDKPKRPDVSGKGH